VARSSPSEETEGLGGEGRGSDLRIVSDPLSGREVIFAPGRAKRAGSYGAPVEPAAPGEAEACPFCEGHERKTPPELFALGGGEGREPDTPGWKVRVVPNLYPAFERQQVVIHAPAHTRSLGEIADDQLAFVAGAWTEVAERAWAQGFDHLFAFINESKTAGASRPHSHSQLVWLDRLPPQIAAEAPRLQQGSCALCALLGDLDPTLKLAERELGEGTVSLAVSPTGRAPYEFLIAPSEHLPDAFGNTELLAAALALAAEGVRRLNATEGPSPFNLWLHNFQRDGHWHLELVPRLNVFAGIELGAGVFVNTLEPDEAVARLRAASSS
jgi:UDPglucose--hexose-1-phosphate uridylyltransferase